jgi:hypothetical protein
MIRDALKVCLDEVSRQKIAIAHARSTSALNPLESEIGSFVCHCLSFLLAITSIVWGESLDCRFSAYRLYFSNGPWMPYE